jgi:hypothetical protein
MVLLLGYRVLGNWLKGLEIRDWGLENMSEKIPNP